MMFMFSEAEERKTTGALENLRIAPVKSVEKGQCDVQQNEVRVKLPRLGGNMGKVLRTGHRIAPFLQVHTQQAGDRGVVLDDEDPMHGSDVSFPKE